MMNPKALACTLCMLGLLLSAAENLLMELEDENFVADPLPDRLPSTERDPEALVGIARGIKASAWTELA